MITSQIVASQSFPMQLYQPFVSNGRKAKMTMDKRLEKKDKGNMV